MGFWLGHRGGWRGQAWTGTQADCSAGLHGDRKDRINDTEPQPAEGEVTVPEDLSDDARAIWDQLAPDLIRVGVITTWDVPAFVMVCEALARYRQATKLANGSALLVQGPNGFIKNPALMVQREAEVTFAQLGARARAHAERP